MELQLEDLGGGREGGDANAPREIAQTQVPACVPAARTAAGEGGARPVEWRVQRQEQEQEQRRQHSTPRGEKERRVRLIIRPRLRGFRRGKEGLRE